MSDEYNMEYKYCCKCDKCGKRWCSDCYDGKYYNYSVICSNCKQTPKPKPKLTKKKTLMNQK